jgi:hypothetical protein
MNPTTINAILVLCRHIIIFITPNPNKNPIWVSISIPKHDIVTEATINDAKKQSIQPAISNNVE